MLNLPDEVEQDVNNFIKKMENLSDEDFKISLKLLIAKYLHFAESDFLLTKNNLFSIVSSAKSNYVNLSSKVYLDGLEEKHLLKQGGSSGSDELRIVSIVQATIGELRKEKILNQIVKFNFKKR